jgi:thioredoxin 1
MPNTAQPRICLGHTARPAEVPQDRLIRLHFRSYRRLLACLPFLLALLGLCLTAPARAEEAKGKALPRLVDLGAGKCIPCKKMAPIIEELKRDYAGLVEIVFVDVWKEPNAGKPYRIRLIPTQIFYTAAGKEVFRHEGFFSREDIEKVFKEKMGVTPIPPKAAEPPKSAR